MASALRPLLAHADDALVSDFADMAARIRDLVRTAADVNGVISPARWRVLQQQISAVVFSYFVQMGGVFTLDHNGDVLPHSAFMRRLWTAVTDATNAAVGEQAARLRKSLTHAPDLALAGERASTSPFAGLAFDLLIPDVADVYRSYVPQYEFTWNDHRTMSDRVYAAAALTRQQVGALTRELLAERADANTVADTLTRYLTDSIGRRNKPYGLNGRFSAERLLKTETTFAYNRAQYMAALVNPFIDEVDIVLSPQHKGVDDCDGFAAGSPYAIHEAPVPPFHSNCACTMRFHGTRTPSVVIDRLRADGSFGRVMTALSPGFAQSLLRGGNAYA